MTAAEKGPLHRAGVGLDDDRDNPLHAFVVAVAPAGVVVTVRAEFGIDGLLDDRARILCVDACGGNGSKTGEEQDEGVPPRLPMGHTGRCPRGLGGGAEGQQG